MAITFLNHIPNGHSIIVDHINNISTDNRLENLQLITNRENLSKDKKNGTSKYTGVSWFKRGKKWHSSININNKKVHLGYFIDDLEASNQYQLALKNIDKYDDDNKKFRDFLKSIK